MYEHDLSKFTRVEMNKLLRQLVLPPLLVLILIIIYFLGKHLHLWP